MPTARNSCSSAPSWFPLNQSDVVAFDEEENPTDLCFQGDNVSPPTGGADTCFPLEAQRISLNGGNVIADDPTPPTNFGWMYLNLNHTLASGDPFPGVAQAWVTVAMEAEGRYAVGFDAIQLDNATATILGGLLLCRSFIPYPGGPSRPARDPISPFRRASPASVTISSECVILPSKSAS